MGFSTGVLAEQINRTIKQKREPKAYPDSTDF